MPIYEYTCQKCDKKFEALILGGDIPTCPACGASSVKRRMSACGFVSKGGGGQTVKQAAGASSCGSCHAGSCAGCKH